MHLTSAENLAQIPTEPEPLKAKKPKFEIFSPDDLIAFKDLKEPSLKNASSRTLTTYSRTLVEPYRTLQEL